MAQTFNMFHNQGGATKIKQIRIGLDHLVFNPTLNNIPGGYRGGDHMVVAFTYAINAYHHKRCEFESC